MKTPEPSGYVRNVSHFLNTLR